MPHLTTWCRIMHHALDPATLSHAVALLFTPPQSTAAPRGSCVLTIDGKTLRGTIPAGQTQGVQLVAAYLPATGVVLAPAQVADKENEITAAPAALADRNLRGHVVTGDALYTQNGPKHPNSETGGRLSVDRQGEPAHPLGGHLNVVRTTRSGPRNVSPVDRF